MAVNSIQGAVVNAYLQATGASNAGTSGVFASMLQSSLEEPLAQTEQTAQRAAQSAQAAASPTAMDFSNAYVAAQSVLADTEIEKQTAADDAQEAVAPIDGDEGSAGQDASEQAAATEQAQSAQAGAATGSSATSELLASLLPLLLLSGQNSGQNGNSSMMMMLMLLLVAQQGDVSTSTMQSLAGMMSASSVLGANSYDAFGGSSADVLGASSSNASSMAMSAAMQSLLTAYGSVSEQQIYTPSTGATALVDDDGEAIAVGENVSPGRSVTPVVTSTASDRSPALYRAVIEQFDVENNYRYAVNKKGTGDTYCNIFLWDVTSAMGAEIPHHTDWDTGAPLPDGASNSKSMNANRISDWLNTYGPQYGWYEVSAEQAQALANRGSPAVTIWKNNEGKHGHVQVVSPSKTGAYDPQKGVAIAQAGRLLHDYAYITDIYSSRLKDVQYFAHV